MSRPTAADDDSDDEYDLDVFPPALPSSHRRRASLPPQFDGMNRAIRAVRRDVEMRIVAENRWVHSWIPPRRSPSLSKRLRLLGANLQAAADGQARACCRCLEDQGRGLVEIYGFYTAPDMYDDIVRALPSDTRRALLRESFLTRVAVDTVWCWNGVASSFTRVKRWAGSFHAPLAVLFEAGAWFATPMRKEMYVAVAYAEWERDRRAAEELDANARLIGSAAQLRAEYVRAAWAIEPVPPRPLRPVVRSEDAWSDFP